MNLMIKNAHLGVIGEIGKKRLTQRHHQVNKLEVQKKH